MKKLISNEDASFLIFKTMANAIRSNVYIEQISSSDKEFHFQDWVGKRLDDFCACYGIHNELSGRNVYPDFTLVENTLGLEVKGLSYPGREKSYDANSNVPVGHHNGRTIYYIFGRYPKDLSEYPKNNRGNKEYPVIDLVMLHGDFLNFCHDYHHENKHIDGFGSYGDIMIRDRKMYVVPTPYHLTKGVAFTETLIQPANIVPSVDGLEKVGNLCRKEADKLLTGYSFNLTNNKITPKWVSNDSAGREHKFVAYQLKEDARHGRILMANEEG